MSKYVVARSRAGRAMRAKLAMAEARVRKYAARIASAS